MEWMWKNRSWATLRSYPGSFQEGLNKTKKHLSHDNRFRRRDLNPVCLKYEAGMLVTLSRHSVPLLQTPYDFCKYVATVQDLEDCLRSNMSYVFLLYFVLRGKYYCLPLPLLRGNTLRVTDVTIRALITLGYVLIGVKNI